jgi:hypothetical protein
MNDFISFLLDFIKSVFFTKSKEEKITSKDFNPLKVVVYILFYCSISLNGYLIYRASLIYQITKEDCPSVIEELGKTSIFAIGEETKEKKDEKK